jgi:hypothetical protein
MRRRATTLAAATVLFAAAGCGGDDDEGAGSGGQAAKPKPTTLAVKISGSAKKPTLDVPSSVKGGVVTIEVTNEAKGDHGVQLVRGEDGHTAEEALTAASAWGESGKALPPWAVLAGGVGSVASGESAKVTQTLPAGSYIAVDIDTNASAPLEVTGNTGDDAPAGAATIDATEYSFEATGLKAGSNEVTFANAGKEPHFIAGVRIKPGKTIEDVRTFFRTEKGEPPIVESGSFNTAIIEGGDQQNLELDVEAGKYALLCFIPDRKGGPPHVVKGMISEATVE